MTWTLVVAVLHRRDALGEVAGEERRARPGERAGQGPAGDVLRDPVEQTGERDLLRGRRPVAGEDLIGLPSEEQRVHALRLLEQGVAGLLVEQRRLPPAVREAAVAILVGPSRRLRHAVQRQELGDDELAHGVLLLRCDASLYDPCSRAEIIGSRWSSRQHPAAVLLRRHEVGVHLGVAGPAAWQDHRMAMTLRHPPAPVRTGRRRRRGGSRRPGTRRTSASATSG